MLMHVGCLLHAAATSQKSPTACPSGLAESLVNIILQPDLSAHTLWGCRSENNRSVSVLLLAYADTKVREATFHDLEQGKRGSCPDLSALRQTALSHVSESEKADLSKIAMVLGLFEFTSKSWRSLIQTPTTMQQGSYRGDQFKELKRVDSGCVLFRLNTKAGGWTGRGNPHTIVLDAIRTFDFALAMQEKNLDLKLLEGEHWYRAIKSKAQTGILLNGDTIRTAFMDLSLSKAPVPKCVSMLKRLSHGEKDSHSDAEESSVSESGEGVRLLRRK